MIRVKDLSIELSGKPILHNIDFSLEDGENLIILGRSGSGKTVLSKTLMGFYPPSSGSVMIDDWDVYARLDSKAAAPKKQFAIVFQNSALLDSLSVFQNVALPLYTRREKDSAKLRQKVENALSEVGLLDAMEKYPSELSGGMRKRVGIARALVYDPDYIVFDEPISGLDPITADEVLFYINHIISGKTATAITITHEVRNLERVGDVVLFLESGKALFYGALEEIYAQSHPLIQKFLGSK